MREYNYIGLHSVLCMATLIACLRLRVAVLAKRGRAVWLAVHNYYIYCAGSSALVCKQMETLIEILCPSCRIINSCIFPSSSPFLSLLI